MRYIIVNKHPVLESLERIIAVVDSLSPVVNRYRIKEIIMFKVDPGLIYRKFVFKRVVSNLIRVVVRISVQLV